MIDSELKEQRLHSLASICAIVILWLAAAVFSLASSPDYRPFLAIAFVSQIGLYFLVWPRFRRARPIARVGWAVVMFPMVVFFIDNIGRALYSLGFRYFRILI